MALVVWGAASVGFVALRLIPGDPVDVMLGVHAEVSEQVRDQIRAEWGLSQPPLMQYFGYLARLVRGDLGTSYRMQQPVADVIGAQLAPTVQLMSLAIVFALVLALGSALLARGPRSKGILSFLELFAVSSPTFWTGLVLIAVFGFTLHWFPVAGHRWIPGAGSARRHPGDTRGGHHQPSAPAGSRRRRSAPVRRHRPLPRRRSPRLLFRHTLRHAAADSITLTGYIIGSLLGGSVLVETVFARPGLGRVALNAILNRDIPVVLGIVVVAAVVFSVINFVVDLVYDRIDPRLASEQAYS